MKKYIVCSGFLHEGVFEGLESLEDVVNENIESGYKPIGGIVVIAGTAMQAMILEDGHDNNLD